MNSKNRTLRPRKEWRKCSFCWLLSLILNKVFYLRAIQAISINYLTDFITVLKREVQNLDLCPLYPCAIIDIIRNLVKTQFDYFQNYLHILVEITLKALETNNPILRKHYHKYATQTLHLLVKNYPTVAFNQQNQVSQLLFFDIKIIEVLCHHNKRKLNQHIWFEVRHKGQIHHRYWGNSCFYCLRYCRQAYCSIFAWGLNHQDLSNRNRWNHWKHFRVEKQPGETHQCTQEINWLRNTQERI